MSCIFDGPSQHDSDITFIILRVIFVKSKCLSHSNMKTVNFYDTQKNLLSIYIFYLYLLYYYLTSFDFVIKNVYYEKV